MITRRNLLKTSTALAGAALVSAQRARGAPAAPRRQDAPPSASGGTYVPVVTPNGWTLPYERVRGAKVFHLVAETIDEHEFAPGLVAQVWGYNGETPGPTLELVEGDHVRIYVTNRLPEPTTVHWHGVAVPNGMDGPAGLNQPSIPAGETFVYEFTFHRPGTFMYHSHFDEMVQISLGMMGMIVVHPKRPARRVDRDFAIVLSEWAIPAGTARPNPFEMVEFNVFTMNSHVFPGTEPLLVEKNERVRIRLGNLSAVDHHPIHLHGHSFVITGTDGGAIPESAWWPETTVLVPVGTTRDIELVADNPGDWALHCHMTHHFMNQMGHGFPNVVGMRAEGLDERVRQYIPGYMTMGNDGMGGMGEMQERHMPVPPNSIPMRSTRGPFGFIDMGGMLSLVKVRDSLKGLPEDGGWYDHPPGTVAHKASANELAADRVDDRRPRRRKRPKPRREEARGPAADEHAGHDPAK